MILDSEFCFARELPKVIISQADRMSECVKRAEKRTACVRQRKEIRLPYQDRARAMRLRGRLTAQTKRLTAYCMPPSWVSQNVRTPERMCAFGAGTRDFEPVRKKRNRFRFYKNVTCINHRDMIYYFP